MSKFRTRRLKIDAKWLLKRSICLLAFALVSSFLTAFAQEVAPAKEQGFASELTLICADGTIWARSRSYELFFFKDNKWQEVTLLDDAASKTKMRAQISSLIGGSNGMVIASTKNKCFICSPDPETPPVSAVSFHGMLEEQGDLLKEKFTQPIYAPVKTRTRFAITKSGKAWCIDHFGLHAFDGEVWHDATEALIAAGIRRGSMSYLTSVGDERVFVSNLALRHDGGESFLGELNQTGFRFTVAPHVHSSVYSHRYERYDRQGALWLHSTSARSAVRSDQILG